MPTEAINISVTPPDGTVFSMCAQRHVDDTGSSRPWSFYILGVGEAQWIGYGQYEVDGVVFTSDNPENPNFERT